MSNETGLALLRMLLSYNPTTGLLVWQAARRGIKCGDLAGGGINSNGYLRVCVGGRLYYAHRVAWALANGQWPSGVIDHINGVKTDNRLINLRDVSRGHNQHNQRRPQQTKGRTSAFLGVSRIATSGKWRAAIKVCGRTQFIGNFDVESEAHAAYLNAKRQLHGATA